jgi:hypothetical protein
VEKDINFTNQKTGEKVERTMFKSYPDSFIGVEDIVDAEDENGTPATTSSEVPPEVAAKLKILAQSKNFADWVDEALTIDWVRDNMLSALSDEGYYNSLKEGDK